MILSLIMATRRQLSEVEPQLADTQRVMTPLSFRHFPSADFSTMRKQFFRESRQRKGVPSLVELMLHQARAVPNSDVPASTTGSCYNKSLSKIDALPLGEMLRANNPFYFHTSLPEVTNRERHQRHPKDTPPKIMHLTSATLIVVPANLVSQWEREISKHCEVHLRVLLLQTKTPVPSVQSLASDYDVCLFSSSVIHNHHRYYV